MSKMMTKAAGIAILIASIGVASCQAFLVEKPGVAVSIEQLG